MLIRSARIRDYSSGATYKYADKSGSSSSVTISAGNSTAAKDISAPPPQTVAQKWTGLSRGAKIVIVAAVAVMGASSVLLFCVYCIRQRRAGRRERTLAEKAQAEEGTVGLLGGGGK